MRLIAQTTRPAIGAKGAARKIGKRTTSGRDNLGRSGFTGMSFTGLLCSALTVELVLIVLYVKFVG